MISTISGCLQAAVEQGLNLPPQLPLLVVCRGHIDEQLVLQQHVDVSSLQTTPAALRPACGLVVLRRQVIQHRALVSPPRLQLNSEAEEVTGETCDLNLEEGDEGDMVIVPPPFKNCVLLIVPSLGCLSRVCDIKIHTFWIFWMRRSRYNFKIFKLGNITLLYGLMIYFLSDPDKHFNFVSLDRYSPKDDHLTIAG